MNIIEAGLNILHQISDISQRMQLIRADGTYKGDFEQAAFWYDYEDEITQKPESIKGFVPQKGHWLLSLPKYGKWNGLFLG